MKKRHSKCRFLVNSCFFVTQVSIQSQSSCTDIIHYIRLSGIKVACEILGLTKTQIS